MVKYKDIITYELAPGISKEHMLSVAKHIVEHWMQNQPGFVKWEIHANDDGSFTDIVHWKSKLEAKKAEANMKNIPNASDWYSCYKEGSVTSKNLTAIATF